MLELEDNCHLQDLFWKTTVTVKVNFRDSYVRIGRLLSFTRTILEDICLFHCQHYGLLYQNWKYNVILGTLLKTTATLMINFRDSHI